MTTPFDKWIEVSRGALSHNLGEFRRILPDGTKLMAVVKANAYGHGLREVAPLALEAGADWLGVNEVDEGLALRDLGLMAPVLVMGAVPLGRLDDAVDAGLRIVVSTQEQAAALAEAGRRRGRRVAVHLKLETGLNRQGVQVEALVDLARLVAAASWLELEGLYTHFANIEDTTDHTFAALQLSRFCEGLSLLDAAGLRPSVAHCACTAAALVVPDTSFDLARVGIGMYGLWPSKETQLSVYMQERDTAVDLRPVMTWKTRVVQVKEIRRGAPIGYGCTERATHDSRIGILPVGYYDGYDRGLSNQGQVLVRGERAFVRGRVCMNMTMVDLTHLDGVAAGEEVVLLGGEGPDRISAEFVASQLGTINYEVVTRVGAHVPRLVVD